MTLLPEKSTALLPFRETTSNSTQPMRVGVVVDHDQPSPWVDALLAFLTDLPGIGVCLLTPTGSSLAASKHPSWLTDRLYSASRAKFDPFGELSVDASEIEIEFINRIRNAGCGVLLWLARCNDPAMDVGSLAKHGAFTVQLGKRDRIIPYWDEVANGEVTSTVTIHWHESACVRGRVVRTIETSTSQGLYVTLNAEEPLNAAIRSLASLCLEIRDRGQQVEEKLRAFPEVSMAALDAADYPTSLEAGQFAARKLARSAYLRWKTHGKTSAWFVAMRPQKGVSISDPGGLDLAGFKEVPVPQGSDQMADPFLWEHDGNTYLLFEEVAAGSSRGRLGCVQVFEDGSCSEMQIILSRPYHLSYPCVVPARGELFLLPETSETGRVDLYRFSRFPGQLEQVGPLVEGLKLVDTTPFFLNDRWYFFTTTLQPFLETLLFWSNQLDGPWTLHPSSPISCSVRNSRSAGNLFRQNGRLYRPTQDCSVRYGYAIHVNEVTKLTPTEFEERAVSWVPPMWQPGLLGTHTWNESSRWQVLDGFRWQPNTGRDL